MFYFTHLFSFSSDLENLDDIGHVDHGTGNASTTQLKSKHPYLYNAFEFEDWERGKRGALHLAGIILCATGCNPLSFKGYGCFCGFMGAGEPVDGIDMYEY